MISISKLSYSFGKQLALKDINFCMKPGEFVFLCGPSGAGKTTFMRILHGALPVQRGKADVAGYDLNTLPESRKHLLRRDVSVVFQDFKLFAFALDQNITASEQPDKARLEQSMKTAGLGGQAQ